MPTISWYSPIFSSVLTADLHSRNTAQIPTNFKLCLFKVNINIRNNIIL